MLSATMAGTADQAEGPDILEMAVTPLLVAAVVVAPKMAKTPLMEMGEMAALMVAVAVVE